MHQISKRAIEEVADQKPAGYVEAIYERARHQDADYIWLAPADYRSIRQWCSGGDLLPPSRPPQAERLRQKTTSRPVWVLLVASFRRATDRGVGDTLERLLKRLGGDGYKWFTRKIGMPCGCGKRQTDFNTRYPYGS